MNERRVERHLKARVEQAGGYCIKWAPYIAGLPDRLVLLPPGRVYLVELKAPGGRLRPAQRVWHGRFARVGVRVVILASVDAVDAWVEMLL